MDIGKRVRLTVNQISCDVWQELDLLCHKIFIVSLPSILTKTRGNFNKNSDNFFRRIDTRWSKRRDISRYRNHWQVSVILERIPFLPTKWKRRELWRGSNLDLLYELMMLTRVLFTQIWLTCLYYVTHMWNKNIAVFQVHTTYYMRTTYIVSDWFICQIQDSDIWMNPSFCSLFGESVALR